MELLRRVHARNIVEWGKVHPNAVVLSGDLTTSCEIDGFRDAYPDRFLSMGLMEQNMMSFSAGLAREGLSPLVHTFAVFMYRRALDQIEMSIAYPNLPVRIFGFLPGVTTPGGASHQAINDIAVLRSLPNMTVIETGDATDVESALEVADGVDGPVYVRMVRGELPRLFPAADRMVLNTARVLSEGSDIALFTSGICTEEGLRVAAVLRESGVSIQHLHVTTLKPFRDPLVVDALKKARHGAIAMENHTTVGGLGSCVAETVAEHGIDTRLVKVALDDTYLQGASVHFLMRRYGIDAVALVAAVETLLGRSLGISEDDLAAARADSYFNEKQQEAL
ncbi:MAG: transketolase [Hyphomicrobiales bacterium]|nr:transketolase [Hyphomicrobiales bacterium]